MTDNEKRRISEMRESGLSYNAIAAELGMANGTVKMYCTRHGLGGKRTPVVSEGIEHSDRCEQCGKPIEQIAGRKHKRFCSYDCRVKWWNSHRAELQQKTLHTFVCRNCGETFTVYGETDRAFCGRKCFAEYRRLDREC